MVVGRTRRTLEILSLVAVVLCYVLLKQSNLSFFTGDESVYFYSGYLWSQGILPYRDFFISHPPIQLLVPLLTILLTGVHLPVLQLLPAFFGALSGILLLCITWRPLGSAKAIMSFALFLLSYATLLSTLHYTGQNLALLLLLLSILLFFKRRKFSSGLILGIAQGVGIHILFPFATLALLQWRWGKQHFLAFVGGFLLSIGTLHALFSLIAGGNFWKMVYLYHLQKPDATIHLSSKVAVTGQMLKGHFFLVLLALFGIVLLWNSLQNGSIEEKPERQRLLLLSAAIGATYLLYLSLISPIFPHYFAPLMPFAAILASEGLYQLCIFCTDLWRHGQKAGALGAMIVLALLCIGALSRTLTFYGYEQRALAFDSAPQVAERIRKELGSEETLFGDFGVVPTIALLSGRRIAGNQVDSSVMRFVSGLYKIPDIIAAIEADHVRAVLTRKGKDIAYYPPFQEYLRTHYRLIETFATPGRGVPIELWIRW